MVSAQCAAARIERARRGREYVLPAPLARGVAPLAFQRGRKVDGPEALRQVALVKRLHFAQMRAQVYESIARKDRHAVLRALAVANDDLAALEIDVFHAQTNAFHDAK